MIAKGFDRGSKRIYGHTGMLKHPKQRGSDDLGGGNCVSMLDEERIDEDDDLSRARRFL